MNNRNVAAAAALIAACLAWAWAFGWFEAGKSYSDDPVVAKLEKQRDAAVPKLQTMSEDERRAQRDTFRKQMEGLTEEQRMAFFESSMPIFVPMMARQFEQRYDQFMALSPEEQQKELDQRIDEMEARGRGADGSRGDRGGRPDIDPKRADAIRKKMLDWTTPEQRAKFEHGIQLLNDRRKERGLPPLSGRNGGFF
ncbi:MAG TPA: hypothetical protein VF175_16420 [Lacipirellula sp.]